MNPYDSNLDPAVEHYISTQISEQFPEVYQDLAPVFIAFVQAYYQWLEQPGNALYYSRRWLELQDIDTTSDDFLIFFKRKFLQNIQLETTSDVRLMIKHTLDIYRSKGSPQCIDLLFRLVFGVGAQVYFPRNDLFQLSSGNWFVPKYLEVSTQPNLANKVFVGKQITGLTSQATAFVERFVRKRIGTTFLEVFYISAINGTFQTGEAVNLSTSPLPYADCPNIIGSLTTVDIVDGAQGFDVGDIVDLKDEQGQGGIARVSAIDNLTGLVSYTLIDGGWGFTSEYTQVFVSQHVLTLANIQANAGWNSNQYFTWFDTLVQPYATLNYINANGTFSNGSEIFTYYSNNAVNGTGLVLAATPANSTAGQLVVSVLSGNLQNLGFFTSGNLIGANLSIANGYTDETSTGSVISESSTWNLNVNNATGSFVAGETVTSGNSSATIQFGTILTSTGTITLANTYTFFKQGETITGSSSGTTAVINSVSLTIGVVQVNGNFTTLSNNYVYAGGSGTNGTITVISEGAGASVNVSTVLLNQEVDEITTDLITTVGNVVLDAATYGMSNGAANGATIIANSVVNQFINVGSISMLVSINPGENYSYAPFVRAYDPTVYSYTQRGWNITYANASSNFIPGDILTQPSSGAIGNVTFANNTNLLVERQCLIPTFAYSNSNSNTWITGSLSGSVANVVGTGIDWLSPDTDIGSLICGLNAVINTTTVSGTGSVASLQVIDAGFAYQSGESLTFTKDGINFGVAKAELGKHGSGTGFYKDRGGFLSDEKRLFDGNYWQYYSYEVRSSLSIDRYEDILKKVLHVAGMKYFGALYHSSVVTSFSDGQIQEILIIPFPVLPVPTDIIVDGQDGANISFTLQTLNAGELVGVIIVETDSGAPYYGSITISGANAASFSLSPTANVLTAPYPCNLYVAQSILLAGNNAVTFAADANTETDDSNYWLFFR